MHVRNIARYVTLVAALLYLPVNSATGQDSESYSLLFRGATMDLALEELVRQTQIDLVYSNQLIKGKRVFCAKRDANAEALLHCVLNGSGLDYIRSSAGTYILIKALKQPPLFGNLSGIIKDTETGAPLPYANILLADGSSGTTTNEDGFFSFKSLISGQRRLIVTYVGYETATDSIWVNPGASNNIDIELRSSATEVGPIVIDGLEQRLPSSTLGLNTLGGSELLRMSGTGTPDVMRGASNLPGVAVQQPLAGIQIQGGVGNEHVTLLDGAPVRDPVSLGRYLGAFSPLALNRMTVYKAGFGAQYGSHLTGIVALDQDLAAAYPYEASFMIDPVSVNGKVKGKFTFDNGAEAVTMGAFRSSNWDVYQDRSVQSLLEAWNGIDPLLTGIWSRKTVSLNSLIKHDQTPLVSFSDLHFGTRIKFNPAHSIHASLYRASNRLESDLIATNDLGATSLNDLFVITDDKYSWLNWAGQMRHSWLLDSQSVLSTQFASSWHTSSYSYRASKGYISDEPSDDLIELTAFNYKDTLASGQASSFERNFIRELTLTSSLSHSFSPFHHVEIGLQATHVSTDFTFKNAFVQPLLHEISTTHVAGFLHDQIALSAYTSLEPSLRLTYVPELQKAFAEPRLSFRIDNVHPSLGNYAFRIAGGVYRQFINQYDLTSFGTTSAAPSILFWLPLDHTVSPPRAFHLAADGLWNPNQRWSINVETFYKWQRLLTIDYANIQRFPQPDAGVTANTVAQSAFVVPADGRSYGGGLKLMYTRDAFRVRAGYDYIESLQQFPGRFDDQRIAVPWNTPNRAIIDASTSVSEHLTLEANWIHKWGKKWALRRAYYDFLPFRDSPVDLAPFDLETPLAHDTPAYQRLDLGATLSVFANRVRSDIQFFITNVLGRNNVYDQQAVLLPGQQATLSDRPLPGRQYTLSIRIDY